MTPMVGPAALWAHPDREKPGANWVLILLQLASLFSKSFRDLFLIPDIFEIHRAGTESGSPFGQRNQNLPGPAELGGPEVCVQAAKLPGCERACTGSTGSY